MTQRNSLPLKIATMIRRIVIAAKPGSALPSEVILAERFSVGRTTVREALKLVEQEGLIDVRHGSGRYVRPSISVERPITRYESATELLRSLGYASTSQVVARETRTGTAEERSALALPKGAQVIALDRVRYAENEAIICSRDVLSHALLADVADSEWEGSLLEILEARGHRPVMATARFGAAVLPEPFASAVPLRANEPWLFARQLSRSATGDPVIAAHDYYRGDLFSFDVVRHQHERTAGR